MSKGTLNFWGLILPAEKTLSVFRQWGNFNYTVLMECTGHLSTQDNISQLAFSLAISSLAAPGEYGYATPFSLRVASGPEQHLWTPIRELRHWQERVEKKRMRKQGEKKKGKREFS